MNLLLVRHADAGDPEEFAKTGQPDSMRPLSDAGRRDMSRHARALTTLITPNELSLLVCSPYVRARQTAEIVAAAYGTRIGEETDVLVPNAHMEAFVKWAASRTVEDTLAIVGHEPHLSTLATWLIGGGERSAITLKKGGACLIKLGDAPREGDGTLAWLLPPKVLRKLD